MHQLGISLQEGCRGRTGRDVACGDLRYQNPIAVEHYKIVQIKRTYVTIDEEENDRDVLNKSMK